jgi:hypothetical protein
MSAESERGRSKNQYYYQSNAQLNIEHVRQELGITTAHWLGTDAKEFRIDRLLMM